MQKNIRITFLLIIFFVVLILGKNLDKIILARANYYFSKNNLVEAQNYYEKAFTLGVKDVVSRNAYVNSIINSPLDVNAQEKLVKFLDYSIDDGATLKVQYFLQDFKREIYKKYPYNYIIHSAFNQKLMHWGKLPITYGFDTQAQIPEYFVNSVENAFAKWEKVTDNQVYFQENRTNPDIIIRFSEHNPADPDDRRYVVAYTTPSITGDKLNNMTISFYVKDINGDYFTKNQVYNTALHEIVHALGFMGHSSYSDDIMYLSKEVDVVKEDSIQEPTLSDINTVKLLYKIKPDITNTNQIVSEYIPHLVLGNDEEVTSAKISEAREYIEKAPKLPAGYIDLAEGYVAIQNYPKAIKCLERALILADTIEIKGMIYYNLAVANYYNDSPNLAEDYLRKALYINNTDEAHYLLAEIYVKQNKFKEAISELEKLIKKHPENVDYTIALANIYVTNKQYMKARKVIKSYIVKNPTEKNNSRLKSYGVLRMFL